MGLLSICKFNADELFFGTAAAALDKEVLTFNKEVISSQRRMPFLSRNMRPTLGGVA